MEFLLLSVVLLIARQTEFSIYHINPQSDSKTRTQPLITDRLSLTPLYASSEEAIKHATYVYYSQVRIVWPNGARFILILLSTPVWKNLSRHKHIMCYAPRSLNDICKLDFRRVGTIHQHQASTFESTYIQSPYVLKLLLVKELGKSYQVGRQYMKSIRRYLFQCLLMLEASSPVRYLLQIKLFLFAANNDAPHTEAQAVFVAV